MNVLLIGATGSLGKEFCKYFAKNKISFLSPSRIELNIANKNSVQKYFSATKNISHVLFCAAYTAVDLAEYEKEKCFSINEDGLKNITLFSGKIPIIHFSTDFVFDGTQKSGYLPTDVRNPINVYGKSKMAAETFLESSKSLWANIRISTLITTGSSFKKLLASKIEKKEPLYLCANNLMIPTFADSLVPEVFKKFIVEEFAVGHYHLPTKHRPISWHGLAHELFPKSKDLFIPIENFTTTALRPKYSILIRSDV